MTEEELAGWLQNPMVIPKSATGGPNDWCGGGAKASIEGYALALKRYPEGNERMRKVYVRLFGEEEVKRVETLSA